MTVANLLVVMTAYYVLSWLPQMVAEAGFPASTASLVGAIANLSGIVGGIALGVFARSAELNCLTVAALIGLGVATAAFGSTLASLPLLMVAAAVCGFFLFGGIAGLYATFAVSFTLEPALRGLASPSALAASEARVRRCSPGGCSRPDSVTVRCLSCSGHAQRWTALS